MRCPWMQNHQSRLAFIRHIRACHGRGIHLRKISTRRLFSAQPIENLIFDLLSSELHRTIFRKAQHARLRAKPVARSILIEKH